MVVEMRGQLLSLDFLISVIVVTVAIGIVVHTYDLMSRQANDQILFINNNGQVIADSLIDNETGNPAGLLTIPSNSYCIAYGNNDCSLAGCLKNIHVVTRISNSTDPNGVNGCITPPCLVRVKTCN